MPGNTRWRLISEHQGPKAGARALRQAIDAAVKGIKLEEYAKEHEELGVELGVWSKKTDFRI